MYRTTLTRTARQSSRSALPRQLALQNGRSLARKYATEATKEEAKSASSHVAAGIGGGAVVLLGVYGYYHYSGAKAVVNEARELSQTVKNVKEKAVAATPSPKAAIGFLRSVANSYAAVIPGGSYLVDQTFNQLEQLAESKGPELTKIVNNAYAEVQDALTEGGESATDKVVIAVQKAMQEVSKLSDQFTSNILKPYIDKSPALKQALGDSLDQLRDFGDKYGPEAKKLTEDTVNQVRKLADQGLNGETIASAAALVSTNLAKAKALGQKAGKDAYQRAADSAGPYLEKAPDVKKYFEENIDKLKDYVGDDGVKLINETYAEVEKAGKNGDTKALAKIVGERVEKLQQLAKDKASEKFGGAGKLFEQIPDLKDFTHLSSLAKEKGGEFESLLSETVDEVKKILAEKSKKAQSLAGEAKDEAKDKISKK